MHFTSIFAGVLAVSFVTVTALPIPSVSQTNELVARDDSPALILRDYDLHIARDEAPDLVIRDVINALYARDLEARGGPGNMYDGLCAFFTLQSSGRS